MPRVCVWLPVASCCSETRICCPSQSNPDAIGRCAVRRERTLLSLSRNLTPLAALAAPSLAGKGLCSPSLAGKGARGLGSSSPRSPQVQQSLDDPSSPGTRHGRSDTCYPPREIRHLAHL